MLRQLCFNTCYCYVLTMVAETQCFRVFVKYKSHKAVVIYMLCGIRAMYQLITLPWTQLLKPWKSIIVTSWFHDVYLHVWVWALWNTSKKRWLLSLSQVKNAGNGRVGNAMVNISWPYEVRSSYPHGKHILYLMKAPEVGVGVTTFELQLSDLHWDTAGHFEKN